MKRRNMMLGIVLLLVVLLIGGGTLAWFTASNKPVVNNFKAGTLRYSTWECFDESKAKNVNPGDCFDKEVFFWNKGTKKMFIRAKVTPEFIGVTDPNMDIVDLILGSGWVKHTDGWYYYKYVVPSGWYTSKLMNKVCFDGPLMGNKYQGKDFKVTIESQAIQASNGAALAEWGVDPSTLGAKDMLSVGGEPTEKAPETVGIAIEIEDVVLEE